MKTFTPAEIVTLVDFLWRSSDDAILERLAEMLDLRDGKGGHLKARDLKVVDDWGRTLRTRLDEPARHHLRASVGRPELPLLNATLAHLGLLDDWKSAPGRTARDFSAWWLRASAPLRS